MVLADAAHHHFHNEFRAFARKPDRFAARQRRALRKAFVRRSKRSNPIRRKMSRRIMLQAEQLLDEIKQLRRGAFVPFWEKSGRWGIVSVFGRHNDVTGSYLGNGPIA